MKLLSILLAAFLLAGRAEASFHLFDIQEVFRNSDGSVLFIELFTASANQNFLTGHAVTFEINAVVQGTVNLSDLPNVTTANKSVLISTANLATLYGVTPDFVIPANFFSAGANNFLNFSGGTDRVNLTLLPTNGSSSLNGLIADSGQTSASTSVNTFATPTNFAGQTATIPEAGAAWLGVFGAGLALLRRRRI